MSAVTQDTAVSTGRVARTFIYLVLLLFALFYLLPLFVMVANSLKPLEEITSGGMLSLPQDWTLAPWAAAWSTAQIGVEPTGLRPYFWNSILMVVPAVAISTILGALNGYVLTKWRFRGDTILFGLMLFACFIPFQIVLIPMARMLGLMGLAGSIPGLVLVHVVYGIGFTTLYFRNYYAAFPTELVRAAMIDGAGFFQIFWRIMLPVSGPIAVVSIIWQFTNIWNDFLFGAAFGGTSQPMTVALNNLVQSSTGVKEYNVHFAGAILAALPTLVVYIVAGRYFVRGLMAGSVKGCGCRVGATARQPVQRSGDRAPEGAMNNRRER
jgi:glucose/mannose transport system permease protein